MDANEYQRLAMRTAGDDPNEHLLNGVMGLCGEAGEVIDLIKKLCFQGHSITDGDVAEELVDVLWYCALISHAIGVPLGTVMRLNIDKLNKRYPDGFSAERSINREA